MIDQHERLDPRVPEVAPAAYSRPSAFDIRQGKRTLHVRQHQARASTAQPSQTTSVEENVGRCGACRRRDDSRSRSRRWTLFSVDAQLYRQVVTPSGRGVSSEDGIVPSPMQDRPSSTDDATSLWRTFLIADIRGYTPFTRERGDAAAALLTKKFGELSLDAAEARNGAGIEERGDEFLAVFESSAQAVRAALEMQASYLEETAADPEFPLRVGIGIDAGEAVPVRDDYRGIALNMAARLCSIATAGQVLVTRTVTNAVEKLNGEVRFNERGRTSLKGFEQLVEVFEAVARRS